MSTELVALFDKNGVGNPSFKYIYNTIYERLKQEYNIRHEQPNWEQDGMCFGCPGGGSNFQVYNPLNRKTILLSFWDRGMEVFMKGLGWENFDLIQYIGGIGMYMDSEGIKRNYGISHIPFQYPLATDNAYEYCQQYRNTPKESKAVFIGALYDARIELADILNKHPKIDVYDNTHFHGESYFKKMSEYKVAISFNGNGEFCVRDVEAMGLGMITVRPTIKTKFHNPYNAGEHYISCCDPSEQATFYFSKPVKELAQAYMNTVEEVLDQDLPDVVSSCKNYFDSYCQLDYMVDLFMKKNNIESII